MVAGRGVGEGGVGGLEVQGEEERGVGGGERADGGEGGGGIVAEEGEVGGGVGHCLEEAGGVVEADAVFVALAGDGRHVVDGDVGGEGGFGGAERVGEPVIEAAAGTLGGAPERFALVFLLTEDFGKDELVAYSAAMVFLDFLHGVVVDCTDIFCGTDDGSGVEEARAVMVGFGIFVCVGAIRVFRQSGVGHCCAGWVFFRIRPADLVGPKDNFLRILLHSICSSIAWLAFCNHSVSSPQPLVCLRNERMISPDHDLRRKLKPCIIAIHNEHQIIILHLALIT